MKVNSSFLFLGFWLLNMLTVWSATTAPERWRPAVRWRGFNIDGRAIKGVFSGEWREDDIRLMHEFGFNFARVMIDYRYLCCADDWTKCDAAKFADLDAMLAWGLRYAVHIQFCLSYPPGIDVRTKSKAALVNDPKVSRILADYWACFAAHFRGVSNEKLSFNLFNEPDAAATMANYPPLVERCVRAIRAEDPQRYIVADGLATARMPISRLDVALDVGQSLHLYDPMDITHHKASWIHRTDPWPTPTWPPSILTGPLYGDRKTDLKAPITLLDLPRGHLSIEGGLVNRLAELVVRADTREVLRVRLHPTADGVGFTNCVARSQGEWAGVPLQTFEVDIPACKRLEIDMDRGDWMNLSALSFASAGRRVCLPIATSWRRAYDPPCIVRFAGFDAPTPFVTSDGFPYTGEDYLNGRVFAAWDKLLAQGTFVMVGEFGVFRETPHVVTLAWMESVLKELKKRNIGWALWNFRGAFGILDSDRRDVKYEMFQGHKLDRKLLDLLQRY